MRRTAACLLAIGLAFSAQAQIHLPGGGEAPAMRQHGIMKSAEEVFYYNCKAQRKGLRLGPEGDRTTYLYDDGGRVVESLSYMPYMASDVPFRHQINEYDSFGQQTRNILLDENGDTLINCHYAHTYDSLGNPLTTACSCGKDTDFTEYRYAFHTDSTVRETFENGALRFREVYDSQGRKIRAYSHIHDGQFAMLQLFVYSPDTDVPPDGLEKYGDVYLYGHNDCGDEVCEWKLVGGKWVESTRSEYVYDSRNNWTSRTFTQNGRTTCVTRDIQY